MNSFIILFLPLLSCIIAGSIALKLNNKTIHYLCSSIMAVAAIFAFLDFLVLLKYEFVFEQITLLKWIVVGNLDVDWSIKRDTLTVFMNLIVTTVSAVVHFYSIGYMYDDKKLNRFIAYLSLFTFFMLILVSSNNIIQLFVGWEGVGLCSYLLIGFWYKKESANNAAMKAFLVNRIGDFCFLIGIIAIYKLFGSVDFSEIFLRAGELQNEAIVLFGRNFNYIDFICIFLFIGCMGKSAQLGLHTWLPDAMEGPTPVSALIHAATMVTAGVFLVIRCSPLFELSQISLDIITLIGALTCIFAASVAIVQNDIKKIIAYSTCSQLGYMFFACGVSAYNAGMFHLVTHAFYKALLFLTAGNVIIALHHKYDIREMGGLWKKLPITYLMVWIGTLAITGFPPFAGYFSKDLILESAYISDGKYSTLAYSLGCFAALLTSFYSFRLLFMVFHGEGDKKVKIVKINNVVLLPLMILVIGSVVSGYIIYNNLHIGHDLKVFNDSIYMVNSEIYFEKLHQVPIFYKYLPLALSLIGFFIALLIYFFGKKNIAKNFADKMPFLYKFLLNKWYFDELYNYIFVRPYKLMSTFCWKKIDKQLIDDFGPNGVAILSKSFAKVLITFQSGYIYRYAYVMILGVVILISYLYL